jgi:multiple sugar transport system permease protein
VDPNKPKERRRFWTLRRRESLAGILFVTPQLVGFLIFVLGPLIAVLGFGFFRWNIIFGEFDFIGFDNFKRLFSDGEVWQVARTTVFFGLGFVPFTVLGGLGLAVALNRKTRASVALRAAYFMPVVISLAAWALVWRLLLQPNGPVNGLLEMAGASPIAWLRSPTFALLSVIGVQILKTLGYSMVLYLAALQTVPSQLIEAAKVDGATPWDTFRYVTVPVIAPFTFMVTVLLTIASFKTFALVHLLTGGGPGIDTTVMSYYIYIQGLQLFEMGYASALATVLFSAVLALTVVQFALKRRWVFEGVE